MLNRTIAPPIIDSTDFNLKLKPYDLFHLDNGVPVYAINAGAQDVLQIEMVFYAGNFFENKKGIAAATNFLLKNGTANRTAFELNEAFEYYGASMSRGCYNETAVLSLHTLSKYADKLLPVLNDMLTNATFPQEELDIFVQNSKQRLSVNLQKCEFVAGRKIEQLLYGEEHPYAGFSNVPDLDALDVETIKSFYKQYYLQGECAIFIAGKLPSNIEQLLNENFGNLTLNKPTFAVKKIILFVK